jgi:plasmid maintenance system killer protein
MVIDYRKNKLKKQLSGASEIKRAFGVIANRVSQRMAEIGDSPSLAVLMKIPAANCHPLTADRKGEWAVDVSGNFRLIFEIDDDPFPIKEDGSINTELVTKICIIEITDYH